MERPASFQFHLHASSVRVRPSISPFICVHSGGYAFFETSQLPDSPKAQNTVSAMLTSPVLKSTGSEGFCVTFSYAMDGLSTDKLRLLLQVHSLPSFGKAVGCHANSVKPKPLLIDRNSNDDSKVSR